MKPEFKILSTTAILGYGFPMTSFEAGMEKKPDLIAADAGSTDPGPYYLGAGISFTDRQAVKRDLRIMIKAGVANKIPVVVGTAGGSGAEPHLDWCYDIIKEIAAGNSDRCAPVSRSCDFRWDTNVREGYDADSARAFESWRCFGHDRPLADARLGVDS